MTSSALQAAVARALADADDRVYLERRDECAAAVATSVVLGVVLRSVEALADAQDDPAQVRALGEALAVLRRALRGGRGMSYLSRAQPTERDELRPVLAEVHARRSVRAGSTADRPDRSSPRLGLAQDLPAGDELSDGRFLPLEAYYVSSFHSDIIAHEHWRFIGERFGRVESA